MRALQIVKPHSEPELREVEQPHPAPGQVVVKVGGAGACHSDIHILHESDSSPWPLPFTIGHENAGWVHEIGASVTGLQIGQPVAVYGAWGCGSCARCQIGMDNYCEDPMSMPVPFGGCGLGGDGGMADYLLVPAARHLVPLPDGLSPADAAPLSDAGLTPYHAIRRSWPKLTPSATAVVIGAGGLGHIAIQILKATTAAQVIAVDTKPDALELATKLGADLALPATDDPAAAVKDATGGHGADVVLDFVGSEATLATGLDSARTLGDLTLVGIAGGTREFGFFSLPYELSLQTVYWGSRPELVELLELGARGLVRPVTTTYSLDQAVEAYRALHEGRVSGRAVIIPNAAP
jgi:alcohol dehydrogenase, propanol-preferring